MEEYWRGEITLRKLRVLVEGLPPDGALARAATGHHWQHLEYMTADLVDLMARLRVDFANANRAEKAPMQPYPEPVWRPGAPSKKKQAKKARKENAQARAGYMRIVSLVTPEYAEKG
ncbi:hypothetical protein [Streptomyces scabiei]|uniref:hypothetical protein n=1 Tax=Streptomyces scabiei TaxID=1930 RepID=UPI0029BD697F|nr:hypothetical protein [Streptomyces scabiei]MDX2802375.1 hypothetical protein [Streptomyces scabiei]